MNDDYERIIRSVVEGQIGSFLNDHPYIANAVRRHKGVRKTQRQWLIGSLSKRIVRDLTCGDTTARLAEALRKVQREASESGAVELAAAAPDERRGMVCCAAEPAGTLLWPEGGVETPTAPPIRPE